MKRIGYLYEKICELDNILLAINMSARHKKNKRAVRRVLLHKTEMAERVRRMLLNHKVQWGVDHYKTIVESSSMKERHITIPNYFPDQIVHWAIMLVIRPKLMEGMVDQSIGSMPDRGPHLGKTKLEKVLRKDKSIRYAYKADIRHFFPSVRPNKLKDLLRRDFKDEELLSLLEEIIDRGAKNPWGGLPIGYYTSQWFSNYYLTLLDHFVLEQIKPKDYTRYVDDILLLDSNKRKLHRANDAIRAFLEEGNYGLEIKGNYQVFRIGSRPIDFLGFRFHVGYVDLRKRLFFNMMRSVRRFHQSRMVSTARRVISLTGWLRHIGSGKGFYLRVVKPLAPKKLLSKAVSKDDRRKAKDMARFGDSRNRAFNLVEGG